MNVLKDSGDAAKGDRRGRRGGVKGGNVLNSINLMHYLCLTNHWEEINLCIKTGKNCLSILLEWSQMDKFSILDEIYLLHLLLSLTYFFD